MAPINLCFFGHPMGRHTKKKVFIGRTIKVWIPPQIFVVHICWFFYSFRWLNPPPPLSGQIDNKKNFLLCIFPKCTHAYFVLGREKGNQLLREDQPASAGRDREHVDVHLPKVQRQLHDPPQQYGGSRAARSAFTNYLMFIIFYFTCIKKRREEIPQGKHFYLRDFSGSFH